MIKKIHSLFMGLVMAFTLCVVPLVSGCSAFKKKQDENVYSAAEWLGIVEDGFNLSYYTNPEPVMQNVLRDDSRFDTVQIAVEWGLIDVDDNIDLDAPITKEFCADTLVCAMNFTDPETADISDADKINPDYLENVKIALKNGIFSLDSGKFNPTKKLTREEANLALETAHEKWVNFSFNESFDNSVVQENVVNFGGLSETVAPVASSNYSISYSGSKQFFSNGVYSDDTTKTITFKAGEKPEGVKVGSVLCFPADEVVPMDYAVMVDSITENADGSVTLNTHNAAFEEIYQDYTVRTHETVNFDNMRVFAPDGTEVFPRASTAPMMNTGSRQKMNLRYDPNSSYSSLSLIGVDREFEIDLGDDLKATISSNGSEVKVKLSAEIELSKGKFEFSQEQSFSVDIDSDYDIGWFLNIKKAYAKCTVKSKNTTELGVSIDNESKINGEKEEEKLAKEDFAKLYEKLARQATDVNSIAKKGSNSVSKRLFDIPIGHGFFISGRLNLSLEGKITITLETDSVFGIEYVKGNLRPIHDFKVDKKIDLSGKAEAKVFLGVTWQAFGRTIADLGAYVGVGATAKSTLYHMSVSGSEFDAVCAVPMALAVGTLPAGDGLAFSKATNIGTAEGLFSCLEIKAYPIFTAELCTKESVIGKYIGGLSCEFLGEDNPFFKVHWDDGKRVDECERGITDTYDIEVGDKLELNLWENNKLVMTVGEENTDLKIRTLPKGLTVRDVSISVEDPSVVTAECLINQINQDVSSNPFMNPFEDFGLKKVTVRKAVEGDKVKADFYIKEANAHDTDHFKLTGISDGVTKITVKAGTFSQTIDVVVGNGGIKEATTTRLILSDTMVVLQPNASHKIGITAAPEGYTVADFTFSADNSEIVSVDSTGIITAHADSGSTIVYVTSTDGKFKTACMVMIATN